MAFEKEDNNTFLTIILKGILYPLIFIYVIFNESFVWIYNQFKKMLNKIIQGLEYILKLLKIVFRPLYLFLKWVFTKIKAFFKLIKKALFALLNRMYHIISTLFKWLYDKLHFIISPIIKGLKLLKRMINYIGYYLKTLYDNILIQLKKIVHLIHKIFINIKSFIGVLFSPLIKTFRYLRDKIATAATQLIIKVLTLLKPVFRVIKGIYMRIFHPVVIKIKKGFVKIKESFSKLINDVKSALKSIKHKLISRTKSD